MKKRTFRMVSITLLLLALFCLTACGEKVTDLPGTDIYPPEDSPELPYFGAILHDYLMAVTEDSELSLRLERNGTEIASYTQLQELSNADHYLLRLQNLSWRAAEDSTSSPGGDAVALAEMNGWTLTAYADSSAVHFHGPTGEAWLYGEKDDPNAPYNLLRNWYDEAEFSALGGTYDKQDAIVIPDVGQDYLSAAKDFTQALEGIHLQASSGSKFCYTFVSTEVSEADDITQVWRENGSIDEDTYCFYLKTAFVEENQRALNESMAGNTGVYTGTDPDVPEGAWAYIRCGTISRKADGWHGELVGTGW